MRTTISLSDGLAKDVRRRAAERGMSVSAFIEQLIRAGLHMEATTSAPPRFRLVTVRGPGLCPGIDLDRAARIVEADDLEAGALAKAGR